MDIKKISEFIKVLATLPDNEQEKVLAYAQGVSAATVAKTTSTEKVSAWAEPGGKANNMKKIIYLTVDENKNASQGNGT